MKNCGIIYNGVLHACRIFGFVAIFVSCSVSSSDLPTVDLSNLEREELSIDGHDLYSNVEKIEIETSDSCLLKGPSLLSFDDGDVFLLGVDYVKRFNRSGKYKCDIGRFGHGYGEYTFISSADYCRSRQMVFVGTFANDVYKYDIDGKYLGKFSVSDGEERLMTSGWSESLGLYVCETRHYRPDGIDVLLSTWTVDGKKVASFPVYTDNKTTENNFTHTGSMRDTDDGMLFMLPFSNTVWLLSKKGLAESFVIERGRHTPSRELVEDNANSAKLEKQCYEIRKWLVTPSYIYLNIGCTGGYRDVMVRRSDKATVYNRFYSYREEVAGKKRIHLKELGCTSFWPRQVWRNQVACLVANENVESNPVLVIATEKTLKNDGAK